MIHSKKYDYDADYNADYLSICEYNDDDGDGDDDDALGSPPCNKLFSNIVQTPFEPLPHF